MNNALIVKDYHGFGEILKKMFCSSGYSCMLLTEKSEAKELLARSDIRIMVFGVDKPEEDIDWLKEICQQYPKIPVIVYGNIHKVEEQIDILEQGARDCVTVNCSVEEIWARIKAILRR